MMGFIRAIDAGVIKDEDIQVLLQGNKGKSIEWMETLCERFLSGKKREKLIE